MPNFTFPHDLDWLRSLVEADPDAWNIEVAGADRDTGTSWPPLPRRILDMAPNAAFLEERDRRAAEQEPERPVADIGEALRHLRILDRYFSPDTLFWDRVFDTPRTRSCLEIHREALEEYLDLATDQSFLSNLIYADRGIREYLIEGQTYRIGDWNLSIPWAVVESGVVPEALLAFGRQMSGDGVTPRASSHLRLSMLELNIHDCPTSNPWLLPQSNRFFTAMSDKWGWYTALDAERVDPYIFYATCVDHRRIRPEEYRAHPLQLALNELDRMGRNLERIQEQGSRPQELAGRVRGALDEEEGFPDTELDL